MSLIKVSRACAEFFAISRQTYVLRGAPNNQAVRGDSTWRVWHALAFVAELTISFILMITVLFVSNRDTIARYTPYFAGALVATYITFEGPVSGMSMNPARTLVRPFTLTTGTRFGSISLHRLWACWEPRTCFCAFAAAFHPAVQSSITQMTSGTSSAADIERRGPRF